MSPVSMSPAFFDLAMFDAAATGRISQSLGDFFGGMRFMIFQLFLQLWPFASYKYL